MMWKRQMAVSIQHSLQLNGSRATKCCCSLISPQIPKPNKTYPQIGRKLPMIPPLHRSFSKVPKPDMGRSEEEDSSSAEYLSPVKENAEQGETESNEEVPKAHHIKQLLDIPLNMGSKEVRTHLWRNAEIGTGAPRFLNVVVRYGKAATVNTSDAFQVIKDGKGATVKTSGASMAVSFNVNFPDGCYKAPFTLPHNYGFIPRTMDEDRQPVHALVIMEPKLPGSIIRAKIIGAAIMTDEKNRNYYKLIAVGADDPVYGHYNHDLELPPDCLAGINLCLNDYFKPEDMDFDYDEKATKLVISFG